MYLDLVSKLLLRTHAADVARAAPGLVGGGAGQGEAGPRGPVVTLTRGQSRGRAGVLIEIRVPVILNIRRELNVWMNGMNRACALHDKINIVVLD